MGIGQKNGRADIGLLILRIGVAALMMFAHGADKFVNFSDTAAQFPDPIGLGATFSLVLVVFAEFFCSIAIGFGFLTRLATIPPIITMLIAALIIHAPDPWPRKELAVAYLLIYLVILIAGPGKHSIDRRIFQKNGDT